MPKLRLASWLRIGLYILTIGFCLAFWWFVAYGVFK